jgi:hypothetical protein
LLLLHLPPRLFAVLLNPSSSGLCLNSRRSAPLALSFTFIRIDPGSDFRQVFKEEEFASLSISQTHTPRHQASWKRSSSGVTTACSRSSERLHGADATGLFLHGKRNLNTGFTSRPTRADTNSMCVVSTRCDFHPHPFTHSSCQMCGLILLTVARSTRGALFSRHSNKFSPWRFGSRTRSAKGVSNKGH